jgi:hypothetical protein
MKSTPLDVSTRIGPRKFLRVSFCDGTNNHNNGNNVGMTTLKHGTSVPILGDLSTHPVHTGSLFEIFLMVATSSAATKFRVGNQGRQVLTRLTPPKIPHSAPSTV